MNTKSEEEKKQQVRKTNKVKCNKCNTTFKSEKYYKMHKCKSKYIKCGICNFLISNNFDRHYESCKKKNYYNQFIPFFSFLIILIRRINNTFKKISISSHDEEKKNLIFTYKINKYKEELNESQENKQKLINEKIEKEEIEKNKDNYIQENKILLNLAIKSKYIDYIKEDIKDLKEIQNKYEINDYSILCYPKIINTITNINNEFIPLISIRQILIDYMETYHNLDNEDAQLFFEFITKLVGEDDEYTNYELSEISLKLYLQAEKNRLNSIDYQDKIETLYYIIDNKDDYLCNFCQERYCLNKFNHLKNCDTFKQQFELNKTNVIVYVIQYYLYNAYLKQKYSIESFINYYKDKDSDYFLKNIRNSLYNGLIPREYKLSKEMKKKRITIFNILNDIEKEKEKLNLNDNQINFIIEKHEEQNKIILNNKNENKFKSELYEDIQKIFNEKIENEENKDEILCEKSFDEEDIDEGVEEIIKKINNQIKKENKKQQKEEFRKQKKRNTEEYLKDIFNLDENNKKINKPEIKYITKFDPQSLIPQIPEIPDSFK